MKYFLLTLVTFGLFLSIGCSTSSHLDFKKGVHLRQAKAPEFSDDLKAKSFVVALNETAKFLEKNPEKVMKFASVEITQKDYAQKLRDLISKISTLETEEEFNKLITNEFVFFEQSKKSLLTSYYEPVISGSMRRTKKFSQPLYRKPKSLVKIELGEFREELPQWRKALSGYHKPLSYIRPRGRLDKCGQGSCIKPFFNRKQIDSEKALKGERLEMVWVDPIDAFFLQIQGSGQVRLPSGRKMIVNYADQNGHPYYAIGKELKDVIPLKEMTAGKIEDHLRSLEPSQAQEIMNTNPSYVFFQRSKKAAVTASGIPALDGRTVAADWNYYPSGALALLKTDKLSQFVFVHDKGGAIRGPNRFDLFWGRGKEAQARAGEVKDRAELWFLVPKDVVEPSDEQKNSNGR